MPARPSGTARSEARGKAKRWETKTGSCLFGHVAEACAGRAEISGHFVNAGRAAREAFSEHQHGYQLTFFVPGPRKASENPGRMIRTYTDLNYQYGHTVCRSHSNRKGYYQCCSL